MLPWVPRLRVALLAPDTVTTYIHWRVQDVSSLFCSGVIKIYGQPLLVVATDLCLRAQKFSVRHSHAPTHFTSEVISKGPSPEAARYSTCRTWPWSLLHVTCTTILMWLGLPQSVLTAVLSDNSYVCLTKIVRNPRSREGWQAAEPTGGHGLWLVGLWQWSAFLWKFSSSIPT